MRRLRRSASWRTASAAASASSWRSSWWRCWALPPWRSTSACSTPSGPSCATEPTQPRSPSRRSARKNVNDADCSTTSTLARSLANSNAGDGTSNIASLVLDKTAGTVTVTAGRPGSRQGAQPGLAVLRPGLRHQRRRSHRRRHRAVGPAGSRARRRSPSPSRSARSKTTSTAACSCCRATAQGANPDCMYGPVRSRRSGRLWLADQQHPGMCGGLIDITARRRQRSRQQLPGRLRRRPAEMGRRHHRRQRRHCPPAGLQQGDGNRQPAPPTSSPPSPPSRSRAGASAATTSCPTPSRTSRRHVPAALACDGSCRGIIGSFIEYVSLADGFTLGHRGGLRRRHRPPHRNSIRYHHRTLTVRSSF